MRRFLRCLSSVSAVLAAMVCVGGLPANAQPDLSPPGQTPLDANLIPQFADPLPLLDAGGGTMQTILAGKGQMEVDIGEFKANVLPSTLTLESGPYDGTWVWGYTTGGTDTSGVRDTYIGPVVVATRGVPSEFKWVNNLGFTSDTHVLSYKSSTDQSIHWANPGGVDKYVPGSPPAEWVGNPDHYDGSIPAAVHLHGAEDPAAVDGGPEAWFTGSGQHGTAFYSMDGNTDGNYSIYRYPNVQEAAPLWFHDHTLGVTRLNVYAGLAGAYLIVDPNLKLPAGLSPTGLRGGATGPNPADDAIVPLVIQDRMFDTDGQLYFPAGPLDEVSPSPNPEHAYWVPEFFGEEPNVHDTNVVNGKVWPYMEVKAQRYRFLVINGSNARTYELTFKEGFADDSEVPAIWQIGTDGGYLDKPVQVEPLRVMPGERADFIVDFAGMDPGTSIVLHNLGPDGPFDGVIGAQPASDPATTGKVMEFRVVAGAAATDTSFDPAGPRATIRKGGDVIVRLADPATATLANRAKADLTRALTLNEVANDNVRTVDGVTYGGGPLVVVLNNTDWGGRQPDPTDPNAHLLAKEDFTPDGVGNYLSELPQEGATEVWEIINTTEDAHPIHLHLVQFQLLNRQFYNPAYLAAYNLAFPAGSFVPESGPPLDYAPSTASGGKYGGNPDVGPYLVGDPAPPNPNEAGWKDTVLVPPGMVTRIAVRFAPMRLPIMPSSSAALHYDFEPNDVIPGTSGAIFDYVWHCHILDHEDNEMMRPYAVVANPRLPAASRSYQMGRDY